MGLLAVLFFSVSIAELMVLVAVESRIGLPATLLAILATGVVGAYLVTRQGLGIWRAFLAELRSGVFPGRRVAEGAMVLVGGAFLFTPGFITDAAGLLLMLPGTRLALIRWGRRYFERRLLGR